MKYILEYDDIIPLGNNCDASLSLRELKIRKETYPFDWVRSNPKIICDVLINGPEKYLSFGESYSEGFEIYDLYRCFLNGSSFQKSHINYYGQHFMHYKDISRKELKEKYTRYMERFFNRLNTSKSILFIHTPENYILHKVSRDVKNVYYNYLIMISEFIKKSYPNLNFEILNIDIDDRIYRNNIKTIKMKYNIPYVDRFEKISEDFLPIFRKEITEIIKNL